jgi:malate/lactate dehydrogenase
MPTPILPTRLRATTGATITVSAYDQNAIITGSHGSAITATLPESTVVNFPIGTQIQFIQVGAGAITVAKTGSDTIVPATSNTTNAGDTLIVTKTAATAWHAGVAVAA